MPSFEQRMRSYAKLVANCDRQLVAIAKEREQRLRKRALIRRLGFVDFRRRDFVGALSMVSYLPPDNVKPVKPKQRAWTQRAPTSFTKARPLSEHHDVEHKIELPGGRKLLLRYEV